MQEAGHLHDYGNAALSMATFVNSCLRAKSSSFGGGGDVAISTVDWLKTAELANLNFVGPALWTGLQKAEAHGELPADLREYLAFIQAENARSNNEIRAQCLRIGGILANAGVEAVLLKGVTWLFEEGEARKDRMMRDIDLLIAAEQMGKAWAALVASGYRTDETIAGERDHIHELPLLCEGEPANVELHVELATRVALLPGREVLEGSHPVAAGLRMPHPRLRIAHNIIHAQITNGDHAGGAISLRDTLDLARLAHTHFDTVDWQAMVTTARQRGYFRQMSGAMHKAARFAGAPLPPPFSSDRGGRMHAARCALQQQHPILDRWLRRYGILRRAIAWERDSYALGLGDEKGLTATLRVNQRRAGRIGRALKRGWRGQ